MPQMLSSRVTRAIVDPAMLVKLLASIAHFTILASCFLPPGITAQARAQGSIDRLLTNVWLVDGLAASASKGWLRIKGDRIAAVGVGDPPPMSVDSVMDLEGRTILPGLIDTHVHLRNLPQARWMLKLLLAHGVTTVKDAGSQLEDLKDIRQWMRTETALPDLYVSGLALSGDSGERRFLSEGDSLTARLERLAEFGVEFIKVHNWLSSDALGTISRFANTHNLVLTGHVPLSMTSVAAIDAGLKILMHTSTLRPSEVLDDPELVARYPMDLPYPLRWGYWAHLDPRSSTLQQTLDAWERRKGQFFFEPTLAVLEGMASTHDPEVRRRENLQRLISPVWRKLWLETAPGERWGVKLEPQQIVEAKRAVAGMVAFAGLAHKRGIRIISGTDCAGGPPWVVAGDSFHRELELLVEAGLSPAEAIGASTAVAAEALKTADRGVIAPGKVADLVVARGNVAVDISAIREIEWVILRGVPYTRTELLTAAARWASVHGE